MARGEVSQNSAHAYHCFDYLRHNIMCAADTTLEKLEVEVVDDANAITLAGKGAMHMCKKWEAITSWQTEQYSPMV